MGFVEAVQQALSKYVVFSGRARRSEYWYFVLFNVLVSIVAAVVDAVLGVAVLGTVVALALVLPGLSVTVRRLHDIGKSGWWVFIALVPLVGIILLIVWHCQDSQPHANEHGPSPKHAPVPEPGYPATV